MEPELLLQVEYVKMENLQADAYREAIDNYRAISQARISKLAKIDLNSVARILPRRQISNYFLEFRKVLSNFPAVKVSSCATI